MKRIVALALPLIGAATSANAGARDRRSSRGGWAHPDPASTPCTPSLSLHLVLPGRFPLLSVLRCSPALFYWRSSSYPPSSTASR
jgi:hypothetical protein